MVVPGSWGCCFITVPGKRLLSLYSILIRPVIDQRSLSPWEWRLSVNSEPGHAHGGTQCTRSQDSKWSTTARYSLHTPHPAFQILSRSVSGWTWFRWSSEFSSSIEWEALCLNSEFHPRVSLDSCAWWADIAGEVDPIRHDVQTDELHSCEYHRMNLCSGTQPPLRDVAVLTKQSISEICSLSMSGRSCQDASVVICD